MESTTVRVMETAIFHVTPTSRDEPAIGSVTPLVKQVPIVKAAIQDACVVHSVWERDRSLSPSILETLRILPETFLDHALRAMFPLHLPINTTVVLLQVER